MSELILGYCLFASFMFLAGDQLQKMQLQFYSLSFD